MPTVGISFVLIATTLPLWALAAAAASPRLPGRWRPLRLLWFGVVYLALEVAGILAAGALWIRAGFGRNHDREDVRRQHYRLLSLLLAAMLRSARRAFRLRVVVDAPPLPADASGDGARAPRPLLVLSRHAGPGDSFLLVHELLAVYRRRPRIVLKATLQWDPVIDLLLNRLPTSFLDTTGDRRVPGPGAATAMVGQLASDLTSDDALVIFPEGGNFTESRRRRAIERLEAAGLAGFAQRARDMRHLVAPRPAGTFAAIDACPHADVVFVAHTGLEQLSGVRDLWRGLPMDSDVRARFWVERAEDVPCDPEARIRWLYDCWQRTDAWIAAIRS